MLDFKSRSVTNNGGTEVCMPEYNLLVLALYEKIGMNSFLC